MKKIFSLISLLVCAAMTCSAANDASTLIVKGAEHFSKPSLHTLWYNQPAPTSYGGWQEYSLPIGNGELGGSVFGGLKEDKITFNEKSLWDGTSTTRANGPHGEYLKFGSIWVTDLSSSLDAGVTDYVRYLDIDNAVAGVQYCDAAGTRYTRTFVSSQPDKVMAVRYTAKGHNRLHLRFGIVPGGQMVARSTQVPEVQYEGASATFHGKLELLSYAAQMTLVPDAAAQVRTTKEGIEVEGARELVLLLTGFTDFDAFNPKTFTNGTAERLPQMADACIQAAAKRGWRAIYRDHVADYHQYRDRVQLNFAANRKPVNSLRDTKSLIDYYGESQEHKNSAEGLFLEQLYYHYGRYLLISSNRHQPVPNNLQGLWNDTDRGHAPWNSDIHTNINIQMNYWPAEPCNLSDLHMPLLDHIVSISNSPGCKAQAEHVNRAAGAADPTIGWVVDTESNLFGGMSNWMSNYTIANAWYVTHLWQHYRYTLDRDFLKRVFPTMWSAAQYWTQRLVLAEDGTYECPAEFSPEQGPASENATAHSQQLVRELFANTLEAIRVLDNESSLDQNWLSQLRERYARLDLGLHTEVYQSGVVDGKQWNTLVPDGSTLLREWKYSPYSAGQNAHRHTSHLMALYPFSQIVPGDEYFQPAINSLTQRTDASTGWAMGWRVNLWARAQDGNYARRMINNALCHAGSNLNYGSGGVYYNLWDAHTPFQIDGNFGVCAGIAEMLLQSGTGVLRLLPALPTSWSEGRVSGLKAIGNVTVDMDWSAGALQAARLVCHEEQTLRFQLPAQTVLSARKGVCLNGRSVTVNCEQGVYSLSCHKGDVVTLNCTSK
ncbi:MAG: glycoside hydrolase family 95 protein [Bacteroidaceae bacterium]|nr:glycoside hydrolase family 95 protein [Bacteroidaceae bacterium]